MWRGWHKPQQFRNRPIPGLPLEPKDAVYAQTPEGHLPLEYWTQRRRSAVDYGRGDLGYSRAIEGGFLQGDV